MHCCKGCGAVLPLVILILTIWPGIFSATVNFWIIIVAAALLLLHAIGLNSDSCYVKPKDKKKKK